MLQVWRGMFGDPRCVAEAVMELLPKVGVLGCERGYERALGHDDWTMGGSPQLLAWMSANLASRYFIAYRPTHTA